MKRLFDIVLAIALLAPAFVIAMLAACLVIVAERHSPFYTQIRLGKNEKPFRIFKIRTMEPSTQTVATHHVPEFAVTSTGRLLRKFKIDELPQLINVLFGQMSLVGPRPGLPQQTELAEARRRHNVFSVVPGVTGLGQVMGVDMSEPERLAGIDGEYVKTQSIRQDIQILASTFTWRKFKYQPLPSHRQ